MIICTDPEFVFVAMPRTASRSMHVWLRSRFPKSRAFGGHHLAEVPEKYAGFFKFAVVRNPFALHLSHYLRRRSRPKNNMHNLCREWSFYQYLRWLSDPLFQPIKCKEPPQSLVLAGVEPDQVLRFETLVEGIERLPFVKGKVTDFPTRNANRPYDTAEHYADDRCRRLVLAFAGGDFIEYNYPFCRIPK